MPKVAKVVLFSIDELGSHAKSAALAALMLASSSAIATPCDNIADLDDGVTYLVSDNKAYKLVDGLVSNEWVPLSSAGYVDDYAESEKAKVIADANARLRRIRAD